MHYVFMLCTITVYVCMMYVCTVCMYVCMYVCIYVLVYEYTTNDITVENSINPQQLYRK